jgi:hypothetical protein
MSDAKPGDKITVKINSVPYETTIDNNGVQRFHRNSVLDYMFYHDHQGNKIDDMDCKSVRMLDLNQLSHAYQHGKFSKRDYAELLMATGYSVSGFSELSAFYDWEIDNPLWE